MYLKTEDESKSVQLIFVALALISVFFFFLHFSLCMLILLFSVYVNSILYVYILYAMPFYISISSYIVIQCTFMCSNKITVSICVF